MEKVKPNLRLSPKAIEDIERILGKGHDVEIQCRTDCIAVMEMKKTSIGQYKKENTPKT